MSDVLDVLTIAEARLAVALDSADATQDARLPTYVTAISRRLDSLCGPVVARLVTGETHDGGQAWIELDSRPVVSVTSITEYSTLTPTVLAAESNLSRPATGYLLEPDRARAGLYTGKVLRRASGNAANFASGALNVVATYTAGRYPDTASVAAHFKEAAELMLANIFRKGQRPVSPAFRGGVYGGGDDSAQGFASRYWIPPAAMDLLADEIGLGAA